MNGSPDRPSDNDGLLELARLFGSLLAWVQQARIQIAAHKLLIDKYLHVTDEEWRQALEEAESHLPADLKNLVPSSDNLDELHTFLRKISGSEPGPR
jgi:hypothetical protein